MVDPDVVLIVIALVRSRTDPVGVWIICTGPHVYVWQWIVLHELEGDWIDQVAGSCRELVGRSVQDGAAWARVCRYVIEWDKAGTNRTSGFVTEDACIR